MASSIKQTWFSLNLLHTLQLTGVLWVTSFLFISSFNARQPFVFHISLGQLLWYNRKLLVYTPNFKHLQTNSFLESVQYKILKVANHANQQGKKLKIHKQTIRSIEFDKDGRHLYVSLVFLAFDKMVNSWRA